MLKPLLLSAVFVLSATEISPAVESATPIAEAPSQVPVAAGYGLSAAQIQKLRTSGIDLVVPAYVPAGYVLKDIRIYQECPKSKSYSILYLSPKNEYFRIDGNACGLGGPKPDMFMEIANTSFGPIGLERFGPNDQRHSNYVATFKYSGNVYYIASLGAGLDREIEWGAQTKKFRYPILRVAGPEMIKIIQNLRPL